MEKESHLVLKQRILTSALHDSPQISRVDKRKIDDILGQSLKLIDTLEKRAAEKLPIYADTDIVWTISGPGAYSLEIPPYVDKPDRYSHLPWSRGMDRTRIDAGVRLVYEIAAKRKGANGPALLYHATTWEINHFSEAIAAGLIRLPMEKVILYDTFKNLATNKVTTIINTSDQIDGLSKIRALKPRRLVLVSHPAHLVRVLYMMGRTPKPLSSKTIVQVYPVPTPTEGQDDYAIMETTGILAYIYKYKKSSTKPIAFEL